MVNKIPTITNVAILNTSYHNVTIRVNVTDSRSPSDFVTEGSIYVYDYNNGELLVDGVDVSGQYVDLTLDIQQTGKTKLFVYYMENDKYLESNARNESAFILDKDLIVINVEKLPSTTNIESILSNKTGNVTLAINVTNSTGDLITTGHIIVFNATNASQILGQADIDEASGKVNITLSLTQVGDIAVNVTYQGNDYYLASNATGLNAPAGLENTTLITVITDPLITISLNKTDVIVGETVRINGTVYNTTSEVVKDETTVIVTIDGTEYTAVFNSNDGSYYYDYTPLYNGTVTINATQKDDNVDIVTSESLNLTVNKIPTIVTITPITNIEVDETFTIEVTLTNSTSQVVTGKTITITVNGVELANVLVTDTNGKTNITYTPTDNTELVIKAVFSEDDVYLGNETEITVSTDLTQSILTVNVDKQAVYTGDEVTIYGLLLDGQRNEIVNGAVTIYINGNRITTRLTNSTGEYSYVVSHLEAGEYTVQAVYSGVINAIIGDEDTAYYTVQKMPTDITVTLPSSAEVFVPFDIIVTLTNNTANTNAISGKTVIITVNDQIISNVPVTNTTGKINISYTPQNNDTIVVKAVFEEDDYYLGDSDTKTILGEDIELSQSTITVDVNKSSLYASESINITGLLVDGQNNIISDAIVYLYINDTFEAIVVTNATGQYSYAIDNLAKGEYTVKAVYNGVNNTIIGDDDTESYVVDKMNTTVTLNVPESINVNVPFDIEVTLTNDTDNNNAVSGKTIVITVNDVAISNVPVTDADGKVTVSYTPASNDTLTIKAVFNEDEYYYGNESTVTITGENIKVSQSTINVSVNKSSLYASESINITGRLVDGQDNIITGADIKIYINDELNTTVQTNATGEYSYAISDLAKGEYTVKAVYDGIANVVNGSSNTTVYIVDKMNTIVTLVTPDNIEVLESFDIEVTLTNDTDNNNPISGKTIVITVNDIAISNVPVTDADGKVIINYTPEDNATLIIKAVFEEDNYYYGNLSTTTIDTTNIALSQSNITVTVNETTLGLGDSVNITGYITDAQGVAIKDATVTITIYDADNNPVNVTTLVTDSNGYFTTSENNLKVGTYTVNASYNGLENAILSSSAKTIFEVEDYSITINVDRPSVYVDEYVTVFGSVYNGRGQQITEGVVRVIVYNTTDVYSQEDYTIVNGIYSKNVKYSDYGKYNVTATYIISQTQNITSNVDYFNVSKIPTITNVSIINSTAGNIIIDVTVRENVTGEYNDIITNGTINVQIADGEALSYPVTSSNTTIELDINTTDEISVSIAYPGSYKYEESTAIDNTTGEKLDTINANPQESTITVDIDYNPTVFTDDVTISGVVYDGLGEIIESGNVTITVDDKEAVTREFTGGKYSYTYTTDRIADEIPVHVEYTGASTSEGNVLILSSGNDTTFNVTKITSTVTITPISDVEVNKEFTIEVTLTNNTDDAISGKSIVITVNDIPLTGIPVTDSNGKTSITYTPTDNTTLVIKAVFNEDGVYLGNESQTSIDVDMSQSTLTVQADKETYYAGETVNITGKLVDGQNNNITNAAIAIYINAKLNTTVYTNNSGEYVYVISDVAAGEYIIHAVYDGITNVIIGDDDTTSYNVEKMPTTVEITLPSSVEVFVPFDIEVTLTNNTANTNAISGKTVIITVNDQVISNVPVTNTTGQITVSYTPQNNETLVIKAVFEDDYYYIGSNDTKTLSAENINISNSTLTVNVNQSQLYVDESIEITGKLTDGLNNPIATADVKIYINNELITTVETNRNGEYSYNIDNLIKGSYDVSVVYDGIEYVIRNSTNKTGYTVSLIPTITTVSVLNSTQSNVTIDVVITENITERHTDVISTGYFEVTVNGNTQQYPVMGLNTTVTLDANALINTTDEVTFNVQYVENDKYLASNGLNASTGEEITTFKADSQQSTITVDVTPQSQIIGDIIVISGHVYDGMDNEITNGTVYITINDETPREATLDVNGYSIEYTAGTVGINNITVQFNDVTTEQGNVLIKSSQDNTTFTVNKIETTTNATILNTTLSNVTIAVNVTNISNVNVEMGSITIYDIKGNVLVDDYALTNGLANITIPVDSTGELSVIVHYNENDKYLPSNATNNSASGSYNQVLSINVTKIPTVTNVEIISNLINNVTLGVNVTNMTGQLVEKGQIVVYDTSGNEITTANLKDGSTEVIIPTSIDGTLEVVVQYVENDKYYNSTAVNETAETGKENIITVNVTKIATKTSVEILNTTIGNITVHISTTNMTDDAVSKGHVVVRDQNNNIIGEGDLVNGGIDITLNVTTPTQLGVNVTYDENDIYLSSNARNQSSQSGSSDENITYIDVAKQNATITINTTGDLVVIGEDVVIYGTVTDGMGMPITEGTVNITINDTTYQTPIANGVYTLTNTTMAAGTYTVNVTYVGNENISSITSENVYFTVEKMPTVTTVEILNNTAGNVTIEVTVTNNTGDLVKTGTVTVNNATGTITTASITDGKAVIVIPTDSTSTLNVNVSYTENTHYYSSNATNSSSTSPEYENIIIIDTVKQNASINIEVLNTSVIMGEVVTIRGQVTDGMGRIVSSGNVEVVVDGLVIPTTIVDDYFTINNQTYTAGTYDVYATYLGNQTVNDVTSQTVNFTVNTMPTVTVVEVLNTTAGNVTVDIVVTNSTGEAVSVGQFNITVNGKTVTVDLAGTNTTVVLNITEAGNNSVSIVYLENENYSSSDAVDKSTIPEGGSPQDGSVLDNITTVLQKATITVVATPTNAIVYEDVTITGTLVDGMNSPIANAYIEVTVNGTSTITKTDEDGIYSIVYTPLYNGTVNVTALYTGNNTVNSTNDTTVFNVDKIATITNANITNTTLGNVTLRVNVTNSTGQLVTKGTVIVYDTSLNELANANLTDGFADITIPADTIGSLEVIVKYIENDLYHTSTSINGTAESGKENITVIDVTRIPTTTTVEVLDNVAGNVTLEVNVTNMTGDAVNTGTVYVRNASNYDQILATGTITDGTTTIKLDSIMESGIIDVIVEYQENNIYYGGNATNATAAGTPDENITVIDVQKQSVTINIDITNTSIIISESTTIYGQVFDGMGDVIKAGQVTVYVTGTDVTPTERTVDIIDDKYNVTFTGITAGNYTAKAKYLGNNSMTPVMSEELNFTVNKIPTKTSVEILNTTLSNVTISVKTTNLTDTQVTKGTITVKDTSGNILSEGTLTGGVVNITIPVDEIGSFRVIVTYNENNIYTSSNATNNSAIGTPDEEIIIINVTRIPTITKVDILNTTINNVTLGITVTNITSAGVTTGVVVVTDTNGKILANGNLDDSYVTLQVPATTSGVLEVIVTYQENEIYLASNATNTTSTDVSKQNITVINVTKLPTITNVEILNTTLSNVTIGVNVTNMTGSPVDKGSVVVYDKDGNILVSDSSLVNGNANISIPSTIGGELDIIVEYQENDYYYSSTALNSSADASKQNITVINVTKIPTKVVADVLNHTAGNITVGVTVTNMTDDLVRTGKVVVKDSITGDILSESLVTDGVANVTIPVDSTDTLKVVIEYQENDYYYPNTTLNTTAIPGEENITVIAVNPQNSSITIEVNNNSIIIGDTVTISGVVYDELGNIITSGQVLVDVNGTQETVDIKDSKYTLEYTPEMIANYTVNATYLGNKTVNSSTTQTLNITVGKIPTRTNVTVMNSTVGNVTIGVTVVNLTDDNVIKGNITVYDMNGNSLVNQSLTSGEANITLPVEHSGQLSVIVTYNENDLYLASNATNSSASGTPSEQIIIVDVIQQDATVTIAIDKDEVTIGDKVTINGTVTDGMGNAVSDGTVTIDIDGEKYTVNVTDGKYSLDNITSKSGNLTINVTYNGKDGMINPANSKNLSLEVVKKNATIEVVQVGDTPGNTSIIVKVTDEEGNPVDKGNVTVSINGTDITVPVVNGTATIPVNTTPGNVTVNVTYNGSGVYDDKNTTMSITTVKLNTTIPIDNIDDVDVGDKVTIHGSLQDQNGIDITNANITVTVNGEKYNTTTNKLGEYTLSYTTTSSGLNNITVEYAGNTIYNPTSNKTNFTVNKKDIVIEVKQTNNSTTNTSIEVKVTDEDGRPVKEGNVIVTMPNGTNITVPVVNGTATVPLNTTPGTTNITVTYNGTDNYDKTSTNITVTTDKYNTTIPIDTISSVSLGDKVNITGKLLDENNNIIPNANITVKVNNKSYTTKTNSKGVYSLQYTTVTGGVNNVTVSYAGNKTYNPTNNQTTFIAKVNSTIKSKQTGNTVGNTSIQLNITDKNGNKVQNGTVIVKDEDGNIIANATVKDGVADIPLNLTSGKHNLTVTYTGNELCDPVTINQSISVSKVKAKITIDTINNITFYQNAQIKGKLVDNNDNPIANAKVTLNMDGVTRTVTTDRYGDYTLEYNTTHVGLNNVTAQYNGDYKYNSAKANATYNASKIITYVTVADVNGYIGENITLTATVTDEYGTKVTGGQFVFKLNGLTLRTTGKFEATGTPMILSPVNGTVTITVVADMSIRSAVNVTGVYGETSKYYSSRSIVPGRASIIKRDAQITVTTVAKTKQDTNITLKAVVTDVTHGRNNGAVYDYDDNFVVFKVNGITIKNEDGSAKQAKVVNGVATMDYYVPAGLAGKYTNLTDKLYTVTAVFGGENYNPGVRNNTTFAVERSSISFVDNNITLNTQTKEMTIKSKIVDYHNNILKGTNTLCVKINGQTYKINNKTVYYSVQDGEVDLNIILPYNMNNINSVELVTGQRVGYLGGRSTITNITRV